MSHAIPSFKDESTEEPPAEQVTASVQATSSPQVAAPNIARPSWKFRAKLMAALVLPVFLETLDYTVVATAQPQIASSFNRLDLQGYIGTIYVLTSTVFLPIFGSLSDVFGRHWALQLSLVLFMLGSALSTGAQNMAMMLAGRGVAGIGAAGLLTVVRVILADSSSLDDNNFQASMLVILYAVGFSIGPYIGGVLTGVNFRWVFAINLPCCVLSMILIFFLLRGVAKPAQPRRGMVTAGFSSATPHRESALEKLLRIDTLGATLFIAGGILVLLALNWGSNIEWDSARVIACFVVGGLCIVGFVLWEWFAEGDDDGYANKSTMDPESSPQSQEKSVLKSSWARPETMIPLAIFKDYNVCATQYAAFTGGMVMLVCFYFLSIFFVIVLDKSATSAGLQLIYFAPGMGAGTIMSIVAIKHLRQPKIPIVLGTGIVPIALGFLSMAMDKNNEQLANGFLVMCGVGIGMTFGPLAIHARFSQPEDRVAVVVSLNLFFRTFGGVVGLAQCSAVLNAKVRSYITSLVFSGALSLEDAQRLASLGEISSLPAIASLPPEVAHQVRDAFRLGVRWAFISLVPWTGLALVLVLFLSNIRDSDRPGHGSPTAQASENADGVAGAHSDLQNEQSSPPKTRIYGPVSLIIYLIKRRREKRRAALAKVGT